MNRNRTFTASLSGLALLAMTCLAQAAPPSSTLEGDDGTLTWTVTVENDVITIGGTSPKWTVTHTARPDLSPIRTERTDEDGSVVVTYEADRAVHVRDGKTTVRKESGLWDADTIDIRLGALSVVGQPVQTFTALDPASGKVYDFQTTDEGSETCGNRPCRHVKMTLGGMLKHLGPKWHYWFGDDGQLLKFEGPAGTFTAKGEAR